MGAERNKLSIIKLHIASSKNIAGNLSLMQLYDKICQRFSEFIVVTIVSLIQPITISL